MASGFVAVGVIKPPLACSYFLVCVAPHQLFIVELCYSLDPALPGAL